jgi:hypothetical protein
VASFRRRSTQVVVRLPDGEAYEGRRGCAAWANFVEKYCPKTIIFGQGKSLAYGSMDAPLGSLVHLKCNGIRSAESTILEDLGHGCCEGRGCRKRPDHRVCCVSQEMGLSKGDTVFIEPHGYELRVRPARLALRRIQDSRAPSHQMTATCRQADHGASGEGGSCVGEGTF